MSRQQKRIKNPLKTYLKWLIIGLLSITLTLLLVGLLSTLVSLNRSPNPLIEASTSKHIIIRNVRISGQVQDRNTNTSTSTNLIIEDGRIQHIGNIDQPPINALEIDAQDLWLSSGLIDTHVHLFDRHDMLLYLAHGITTVRNMSGERKTLKFRQEQADGQTTGPRLLVSSPVLNQHSRYASSSIHRFINDPGHARRLVKKYKSMGYDLIKVYDGLRKDVFDAIVDESQQQGLSIAGHPSFFFPINEFIVDNLQTIEHVEMLYQAPLQYSKDSQRLAELVQELTKELKDKQIHVTPTLLVFDDITQIALHQHEFTDERPHELINPYLMRLLDPWINDLYGIENPQSWQDKSLYLGKISKELNNSGIPLVLGSDGGYLTLSGIGGIQEMQLLKKSGISIPDILNSATINAVEALQLNKKIKYNGKIEEGDMADLILSRTDPLQDLNTYYELEGLIQGQNYYPALAIRSMKDEAKQHMNFFETMSWFLIEYYEQFLDS
ncbi:MAG: hypothetical protein ACI93R_001127 [Flavobacteriales bacterium]|jgi:hypothetical protein